jgi:hypothetical protein
MLLRSTEKGFTGIHPTSYLKNVILPKGHRFGTV